MSVTEIVSYLDVSKRTILRDIEKLKENNLLKRVGSEKSGHWEIVKNK
jgi:DeoR/GlpR family transcriptional regulator of sugar metabolism